MITVTDPMLEFEFRTLQASKFEPGEVYFLPPGAWFISKVVQRTRMMLFPFLMILFVEVQSSLSLERSKLSPWEVYFLPPGSQWFLTQLSKSPPDFTARHLGDPNLKNATFSWFFMILTFVFLWETRCTNENGSKRSMMPVFRRNTQRQILGC